MKRPAVHNAFRFAFIGFGICCFAFTLAKLSAWIGYKKTASVVELVQPPGGPYGTNPYLRVTFMRPAGSQGFVRDPEKSLPTGVTAGDHVWVLYRPDGGEGFIYSFDTVWRIPLYAAVVGTGAVSIGVFLRRRPGGLFRVNREHTA